MDMDVATDLGADARGAGMIAKTERELILTKPSAYTTWKAKQVTPKQSEIPAETQILCFRRRSAWSTFSTAPRPTSGSTPASPPSHARSTQPTRRSTRAPRFEFYISNFKFSALQSSFQLIFCPPLQVVGDHGHRGRHRRRVRTHLLLPGLRLQALRLLERQGKHSARAFMIWIKKLFRPTNDFPLGISYSK